jgi:nucleoside 2-deoxyribosyltransferase
MDLSRAHRSANAMANLNDFRGPGEADRGTAFEVGFASALGKPVWGYRTVAATLLDHVPSTVGTAGAVCRNGYLVENFGMSVDLMPSRSSTLVLGGWQECLAAMRR